MRHTSRNLYYCADLECPSHFKCDRSYCVHVRHMCDMKWDCPLGEDENSCIGFNCQGFYLCPVERLCLSFIDVCDGKADCKDTRIDELLCEASSCPQKCFCVGYIILCDKKGITVAISSTTSDQSAFKSPSKLRVNFPPSRALSILNLLDSS